MFGDTFFIGISGSQLKVSEVAVVDEYLYAACNDFGGIKNIDAKSENGKSTINIEFDTDIDLDNAGLLILTSVKYI